MGRYGVEVGWEYLTQQQRDFCVAWVKYHDKAKALAEAGYAPNTPVTRVPAMLKRCKRYLDYLEAKALEQANISVGAIQIELSRMGFSNLLNYYVEYDHDGKKHMRPKALNELSRAEAAAIKEWEYMPWKLASGEELLVLGSIKLHDKRAALVDLGKTIGMFQDKLPPGAGGNAPGAYDLSRLSTDKLKSLENLLRDAAHEVSEARDSAAIPAEVPAPEVRLLHGPASS